MCESYPDMVQIQKLRQEIQQRSSLADSLALIFMGVYSVFLWRNAHFQVSVLDEGLYLYKGWLFANKIYTPFQPNGLWTNQMPLSFLIPGWIEQIFGPGLQTGRMMAVVLGFLTLPAVWLTSRRLGGHWIAAGVMGAMALNPAAIKMVSLAASQGMVAFFLAWTMWFSLGNDRSRWQLLFGGLFAGCLVMVRINMLPLLPLLVLYILWIRGWRQMLWSLFGILLVFCGVHYFYWPNILKLWAKWLPFPFLKNWFPPQNLSVWKPDNPIQFRIASFFLTFRYHFTALAGALCTWIFWPKHENDYIKGNKLVFDPGQTRYKTAVFLSLLLIISFLLHAWAALGNEYCVFCFPTYTAFYSEIGLLLFAITIPVWAIEIPSWKKILSTILFFLLATGMAYSAEGAIGNLFGGDFYKRILSTQIPGTRDIRIWQILANKFHLRYETIYDLTHTWFPVYCAVLLGVVFFFFPDILRVVRYLFSKIIVQGKNTKKIIFIAGWNYRIIPLFVVGILLSPTTIMAGDYNTYDCGKNTIPAYENIGAFLSKTIKPGSSIFWAGYSPVTLLYLPGVKIFPAQLHGIYSFRISPDDEAIQRYGWWNEHLAEKWLNEADYIIVEQKNLDKKDWLAQSDRLKNFNLIAKSNAEFSGIDTPEYCITATDINVYRRK